MTFFTMYALGGLIFSIFVIAVQLDKLQKKLYLLQQDVKLLQHKIQKKQTT
jgi:cell division protein FtsL